MNDSHIHNFGAGPCILPEIVLSRSLEAATRWNGGGLSILEISSYSAAFEEVMNKMNSPARELIQPD